MGYEKIPIGALRVAVPVFARGEDHLLAFRFAGKRMLGVRSDRVFHVLLLDIDFTAYAH